jgi:DNA polymerase III delta prime subunit
MNDKSFNTFLKTLEESPKNTFFICTTSNIWFLPDTIKSRFLKIEFQNLNKKKTFEILKEKDIKEKDFQDIFDLSLWKLKIIESFLENSDFFEKKKNEIIEIENFLEKNSDIEKINRALIISWNKDFIENEIENFFIIIAKNNWKFIKIFENLLILKDDIFSNVNKKIALEHFYFNSF